MNLILPAFVLAGALMLLSATRARALSIVRGTSPWEHDGVTYKAIQWSNDEVDLHAQLGDRLATIRYRSPSDLTVLAQSGDLELGSIARAYMLERGTLVEGTGKKKRMRQAARALEHLLGVPVGSGKFRDGPRLVVWSLTTDAPAEFKGYRVVRREMPEAREKGDRGQGMGDTYNRAMRRMRGVTNSPGRPKGRISRQDVAGKPPPFLFVPGQD